MIYFTFENGVRDKKKPQKLTSAAFFNQECF